MNQFVVIFVPPDEKSPEVAAILRERLGSKDEFIKIPGVSPLPDTKDAEQMPLWRWFGF